MTARATHENFRLVCLTLTCVLLIAPHSAASQPPAQPTIEQVLQQLEDNLHHYEVAVPGFFCDEHVFSTVTSGPVPPQTATDSTFRLKRTQHPDGSTTLDESRDVKTVNGRRATTDDLSGPAIVSGAFSGGLAIVSRRQQNCMSYKLRPVKHPRADFVVEFSSPPRRTYPENCILPEEGTGRIVLESSTMQVKRMELTAPHHTLEFGRAPDGSVIPPVTGQWFLTVTYRPVPLGGEYFWLPATISSTITAASGPNAGRSSNTTTWSFDAHYRNYHKLEVTSRILPATDPSAP